MATEIVETNPAAPPDMEPLRRILDKFQGEQGVLIPILQETQDAYGYLPEWGLESISAATGIPLAQIYGVATFYAQFRLAPIGKHLIRVCCGTACHVAGAEKITDSLAQTLETQPGETTADGLFTLETVACLGCCSLAPVMMIDDETHGRLDDKSVRKIVAAQKKQSQSH